MPRLRNPLKIDDYAMSFAEVGDSLRISSQAANHAQQRALAKLRKRLNAMGFYSTQDLLDAPEWERKSAMQLLSDD